MYGSNFLSLMFAIYDKHMSFGILNMYKRIVEQDECVIVALTCLAPSMSKFMKALPSLCGKHCIFLICLKSARKTA